ncbi:YcxB family protein [Micromonospora sp. NPDC050200]|uniref:YcxB family protein n=1 Tax=Micromonospora sp. NPDC050200 TaxID=3155664 RepID=UPI0033CDE2B1
MISFETRPDRRRLTAALRRAHRRMLLLYRLCPLVLLLPALVDLLTGDPLDAVPWIAAAVTAALLSPLVVRALVRANWKMYGIPIRWTISDEGVRYANALSDGAVRWEALTGVESIPGQLLFRLSRYQVFPVPIDGLAAEQRAELYDFLRGRGLLTVEPIVEDSSVAPAGGPDRADHGG